MREQEQSASVLCQGFGAISWVHVVSLCNFSDLARFKTCDIYSLSRQLVLGFGYCLIVSWLFRFAPSVNLIGFYAQNEPTFRSTCSAKLLEDNLHQKLSNVNSCNRFCQRNIRGEIWRPLSELWPQENDEGTCHGENSPYNFLKKFSKLQEIKIIMLAKTR